MIKEDDLLQAIAECQGQRNPNASTCIKLASYYTILDRLNRSPDSPTQRQVVESEGRGYSFSPPPDTQNSEFLQAVGAASPDKAWTVIDELMGVLSMTNPKLYNGVMRKIYKLGERE